MHKITLPLIICTFLVCGYGCSVSNKSSVYTTPLQQDIQHLLPYISQTNYPFSLDTIHLVDFHRRTGNYIFRGNTPLSNGIFPYEKLMSAIKHIASKKLHRTIDDNHFLINISLINNIAEESHLKTEELFFKNNPDKGEFINHPIYGAPTSPNNYPPDRRKEIENTPDIDDISGLLSNIKKKLDHKKDRPQIIYIHCQSGFDRTGVVIAAYQMRYSQCSYESAYINANKIAGRLITNNCHAGLQWYAYYLQDIENLTSIGAIN
ncbi:MAG: dual specificity protein phosphatase family protein [Candidatus Endonucleobacter sp. (ex Gigantidas childressi)]|nr:dual specificity protein phosphatase family protein [Candidatus Endonucleobacter sp. (ex Gigantidas childressi)]